MLPIILNALRPYAAYITFPVALVFGFAGYHLEGLLSDRHTPSTKSVETQRLERQLQEDTRTQFDSLKERSFMPKTVFERNLSPSLSDPNKS